jgi:hypothetical protein
LRSPAASWRHDSLVCGVLCRSAIVNCTSCVGRFAISKKHCRLPDLRGSSGGNGRFDGAVHGVDGRCAGAEKPIAEGGRRAERSRERRVARCITPSKACCRCQHSTLCTHGPGAIRPGDSACPGRLPDYRVIPKVPKRRYRCGAADRKPAPDHLLTLNSKAKNRPRAFVIKP